MKLAIDVETTGLTWKSRPYMLSVYDGSHGAVLDLRDMSQRDTAQRLLSCMTTAIGANTWFDLRMLACTGLMTYAQIDRLHVRDVLRDGYFLSGEWKGLKAWGKDLLNIDPLARDEVLEAMRLRHKRCNTVYALTHGYEVWDVTSKYCQLDSVMAWDLAKLLPESDTSADKVTLMQTLHGVRVDVEWAKKQAALLWNIANGHSIKHGALITSPLQIAHELGIRNADKKALSTRTDELSQDVLKYREVSKLAEMIDGVVKTHTGGYVHPLLTWQCVTGRASCSSPNLQQFHNHEVEGIAMREIILPDSEDHSIVSADYSGIELALYAHATDSEKILAWLAADEDPHNHLTELVFGETFGAFEAVKASAKGKHTDGMIALVLKEVNNSIVSAESKLKCKRSRNINKRLMFGTIYGAGIDKVAAIVGISVSEARKLFRTLCQVLPELPKAKRFFANYVERHGHVINMCDRKVGCKKPHAGMNTLIQSSAADIMRKGLVDVQTALTKERMGRAMFTVHDELVNSVRKGAEEDSGKLVSETMTAAATSLVGFVIKAEPTIHGERWGLK